MTHRESHREQRRKSVGHLATGILLVCLLGASAGLAYALVPLEPSLDPIVAYCHGVNDGQVIFGTTNRDSFEYAGIPYSPPSAEEMAVLDSHCVEYLRDGGAPPEGARGPLGAG